MGAVVVGVGKGGVGFLDIGGVYIVVVQSVLLYGLET